jgi:hypothetical protein
MRFTHAGRDYTRGAAAVHAGKTPLPPSAPRSPCGHIFFFYTMRRTHTNTHTHTAAAEVRSVLPARRGGIPPNARCLPVPLASCCCARAWLSSHPGPGAARAPRRSPVGSTPCVRASCVHALALFYPPVDTGGLGSPPVRLGAHCSDGRHRHYPLPAVLRKVMCCRGGCHDAVACPSFKVC